MIKITLDLDSCPEILPPGTCIVPLTDIDPVGNVSFSDRKSLEILSPYVEAFYNAKDNVLIMNAVVYVDVTTIKNGIFSYKVYQNSYIDIEGHAQLQFFISYNQPEKLSENFSIYEIVFNADPKLFPGGLSKIDSIQTFLWDSDPETSRGTETTVQRS